MPDNKWANQQIAELLEAGVNPLDAQRSASWVLDNVPVGDNPVTWVPIAVSVAVVLDRAALADVRAVWYERKPVKIARMLDARKVE